MNDDFKRKNSNPAFDKNGQQGSPSFDEMRKEKVENFQLDFQDDFSDFSNDIPQRTSVPNGGSNFKKQNSASQSEELNSFSSNTSSQEVPKVRTPEEKKAERAAVKAEKKRKKKKAKKNGCLFKIIWMIMIVLVSVVLAQYILVGVNDMLAINRTESTVAIEIPKDVSVKELGDILSKDGVIKRSDFFSIYCKLTKRSDSFTKGTYDIKTNLDYEAIINFLHSQSNRKDTVKVTFTEGMTVLEYAQQLEEKGVCSSKDFLEACNSDAFDADYSFLASIENKADRYYKLEGYLFPDTYDFYLDEDPLDTISRMLNNYEKKIVKKQDVDGYSTKMSIEDLAREKGMTPEDLLTLASMVQAEAADVKDMGYVASIFTNRLNADVNVGVSHLGSDPTQFYPYKSKEEMPDGFESTYDTYNILGLPAGPICNPGMDAINAALNPNKTNYLYFCHAKDGTAYYAETPERHEANKVKAGLK